MDEKESLPLLALQPGNGSVAVARKPRERPAVIWALVATLSICSWSLYFLNTGGSGHHVRVPSVLSSSSAADTEHQIWPTGLDQSVDHQPVVGSSHDGVGEMKHPAAGLSRDKAGPGAGTPAVLRRQSTSVTTSSATATSTVLEDFEVHQPVLTPEGATLDDGQSTQDSSSVEDSCSVVLMDHVFAYSYGEPYVGNYTPPTCEFNRVAINFTVVSEGRQ